eukprot:2065093-Amphidinium_carterae.1
MKKQRKLTHGLQELHYRTRTQKVLNSVESREQVGKASVLCMSVCINWRDAHANLIIMGAIQLETETVTNRIPNQYTLKVYKA